MTYRLTIHPDALTDIETARGVVMGPEVCVPAGFFSQNLIRVNSCPFVVELLPPRQGLEVFRTGYPGLQPGSAPTFHLRQTSALRAA